MTTFSQRWNELKPTDKQGLGWALLGVLIATTVIGTNIWFTNDITVEHLLAIPMLAGLALCWFAAHIILLLTTKLLRAVFGVQPYPESMKKYATPKDLDLFAYLLFGATLSLTYIFHLPRF